MGKSYRTNRGLVIDYEALMASQGEVTALGNMSVNARGDILGAGGRIVKTRNEVIQEYHQTVGQSQRSVSITEVEQEFLTPQELADKFKKEKEAKMETPSDVTPPDTMPLRKKKLSED